MTKSEGIALGFREFEQGTVIFFGYNQGHRGESTSHSYIRLISVITSFRVAYKTSSIKTDDDLYEATYKPATERFQYYLQDLERETGVRDCGIVVCDHRNPKNGMGSDYGP